MFFTPKVALVALSCLSAVFAVPQPHRPHHVTYTSSPTVHKRSTTYYTGPVITPKAFIISLFSYEEAIWHTAHYGLNVSLSIPGLSPIYPTMYCNAAGSLCQVTTGESEINAAATISAVVLSQYFDLSKTYFLVAGIAGVNPACGTIGGVALARYTVQVGLEYEIAPTENLTAAQAVDAGYIPLGAKTPDAYPGNIYGTEVFELNAHLRNHALTLAKTANLTDSATAKAYRAHYPSAPANQPPTVFKGDSETSDVYWHGVVLGDAFEEYFGVLTNGSGKYCMTAQEDNAVLEAMIRGAQADLVDFTRIMVMRAASNFDREYPGETAAQSLLYDSSGGFGISLDNLYNAGSKIIDDILANWAKTYEKGIAAKAYTGDILNSVPDGFTPNIGTPSAYVNPV